MYRGKHQENVRHEKNHTLKDKRGNNHITMLMTRFKNKEVFKTRKNFNIHLKYTITYQYIVI